MTTTPDRPYREWPLEGRHVVLAVTGSIAAYKAADLASKIRQAGASLEVVMTPAATEFVTPLTFQSLSGRDVVVDMFTAAEAEAHVEVARRADVLVIAPASADCLANLAHGATPDMVTTTALATTAPILVAPAMDSQMWTHPATQANVHTLLMRGVAIVGPEEGRLATGRRGQGRLAEPATILGALRGLMGQRFGDLRGRHVVVTAGPTQEPLDPVRFIGNRSSGKMGFAVAEAARDRGARVTLITGPVALETPYGVDRVDIRTVADLLRALQDAAKSSDAIVMAAAPADFRPKVAAERKIKKEDGTDTLVIELEKTPDVIASVEGGGVRVGFAAETHDFEKHAREKLARKRLHYNVLNDVTAPGSGFGTETNEVTIFGDDGSEERLPLLTKYGVANRILDLVASRLASGQG